MPTVLVHGVPDSHRMWEPLRDALGRPEVAAPDLPGFAGAPLPAGFDCSKEAYLGWLEGEVERAGGPVDLVGHDWGAMLCLRLAALRPDLVRTLAVGSGPVDEQYTWHDTAQLWQTPEVGEQVMEAVTPELLGPGLEAGGMPAALAAEEASLVDETMKRAILALYRSAIDVGREWGPDLARIAAAGTPALVLWGAGDPYCGVDVGERIAARTGARLVVFESTGHWWPAQRPVDAAAALQALWEGGADGR